VTKEDFILKLLGEGREYLKMILPVFLAWHLPSPSLKKASKEEG
jgi:hypothetical protein